MFKKLCDNLNSLMKEMHISAEELARRTGIPPSTIKKIRNRYNPNPTLTTLMPLAQFFSITLDQLVGNEPLPEQRIKGLHTINLETIRHIPILTWTEAITWPKTINDTHICVSTEYEYSHTAYALIVEDADWENITRGTALLIDPLLKAENRDLIIVHKEGQQASTLKQALFDEGILYLKSMLLGNNIAAATPEHKQLGVVVEFKKLLKKSTSDISVESNLNK